MRRGLSPAGWPRPRTPDGRFPIPWVTPIGNLGAKDRKRMLRVAGGWVCQVCGLRFAPDEKTYCVVNIGPDEPVRVPVGDCLPDGLGVHAMDHGLLHDRCLRLALAWCPELKRLREVGELVVCEVPAGSVEAFGDDVLVVGP